MDGSRVDWVRIYAWQGRLCSKVFKELYSVSTSCRPPDEIMATVNMLSQELSAWRDSTPMLLRPSQPITRSKIPICMVGNYSVVLPMMYWHLLCIIQRMSIHCSSWLQPARERYQGGEALGQSLKMDSSSSLMIEAARTVVKLTEHLDTESYTPSW